MHDMRAIREDPKGFDAGLAKRGVEPIAARIVELDERRRAVSTQVQEAQARRNEASKAIGAAMGKGDTAIAEALKAEVVEPGVLAGAAEQRVLLEHRRIGEPGLAPQPHRRVHPVDKARAPRREEGLFGQVDLSRCGW